ncbi:MAG: hypothetical protein DSY76_09435 [Bacteroidetes bacterium]|nr:MAG: hypothetical protein DSY76_09435 [Bacteroidota bacterium]
MSGIFDLLQGPMGQIIMQGASSQLGLDSNKTQSAMSAAIPMLMGALKRQASNPDTASGLFNALRSKHDGSILDNVMDIFGGGNVNEDVVQDGDKILGHVLGGKKEVVAEVLSKQKGIDIGSAMNILKMAAPLVMGMLGRQTRQTNVSNPTDLTNIIGNMLGGHKEAVQHSSFIESILDADNDGSIIDDLFNMGKKFFGR